MMEADTIEIKGLEQILKALKARMPVARVGILGGKDARSGKGTSNASVGAAHEFGTSRLPKRSFLREPLIELLQKKMESSHAFDKDTLTGVIKSASVIPWLKKVAAIAEEIVSGAFDSAGYGRWAPWSKGYTNNTGQILVDSQQLRNSISSEVKA